MTQFVDEKKSKKVRWLIIGISIFLVSLLLYGWWVNNCVAGYYHIVEPIGSKKMAMVVDSTQTADANLKIAEIEHNMSVYRTKMTSGRYLKWLDRVHVYEKSMTFWFSADKTEGSPTDESVLVRYNDGGTANISGSVRVTIGPDEDKFKQLHIEYRNPNNFRDRAIRQLVSEALTLTATLMSAEESYTSRKAQFTQWALDQLNNGVYMTDTAIDTVTAEDGSMKIVQRSTPRLDENDEFMRKPYSLASVDVTFSQFVIQDPNYERSIKTQIATKLKNLMGKVASGAEGELAATLEAKEIAEGEKRVVEAKYAQDTLNVVQIVNATIDKDTSEVRAKMRRTIASIKKDAAGWDKRANILQGQGQAEYKRLLQSADKNLNIRLEMWLEGHNARADAIANGQDPVSEIVLSSETTPAQQSLEILNLDATTRLLDSKKQ
ncbi:hypothetical protein ACFL1Y_00015 [Patescibacteria group bacterium]